MKPNEITKNEIKFSTHYLGSKDIVKAVNFKAVEADTTISEFVGPKQRIKINSDGYIHLMPAFEQYLQCKSSALLPMDLNLTFKEIERAKRFYSNDDWFTNSILTKEDRENKIKEYESIRLEKKKPAEEREAAKRKAKYEAKHKKYDTPIYDYDPVSDIEKYGSFSITAKF